MSSEKIQKQLIKSKEKPEKKKKGDRGSFLPEGEKTKVYLIFSFLLPMILMIIGFANKKIFPFGDQQILVTDLWHQYYPFFRVLHEKLQSGASLLYTWQSGMGTNFISLMAYYCASPLNLLSILVSETYIREALAAILVLKIGCAGLFFAIFLKKTFGRNDMSLCIFSVLFALCSYIMGYYWNVIWIDTVALLPLVVLGVEQLVKTGKYRLYVISLALCLISNYYIALFVCIFTVFAFIFSGLFFKIPFKKYLFRFVQIALFTILALAAAAVIILPTFNALQLTHSVDNTFPKTITWYENFRTIIANMIAFHEPTSVDGLPNIYSGALCIVLIGVYLRSPKIMIREKISSILMLAFILISCNMNILNYLWHGMHFTNQIPYRFAFLFSFVLITMSYRAYTVIADGGLKIADILMMVAVTLIFFSISYTEQEHKAVLYTMIICAVYIIIMFLHERKWLKLEYMNILLALVVLVEMSFEVKLGIKSVRSTTRTNYPANSEDVSAELDRIEETDGDDFYRTEMSTWYTLNDPSLYGYNGVSQFSSMANENISKWIETMGVLGSAGGNRYFYASTSPLTNILTDVKYMIAKDNYCADTYSMSSLPSETDITTYKNNYHVGLGFVMDDAVLDFSNNASDYTNPFEAQNEWVKATTDIEENLFTAVEVKDVGHKGLYVTRNGYGKYSYQHDDNSAETKYFLKYNYLVPQNGMVYAYTKVTNGKSNCITMEEGNELHTYNIKKQPYIFPVGSFNTGTTVTLKMPIDTDECSGSADIYLYTMNEDVFQKVYDYYSESVLKVSSYDDTHVNGTINAANDGLLYTSIPYEKGWTVKVDGKKVKTYPAGNAMLSVYITAGQHEITYSYIPDGFVAGLILSVSAVIILILLYIIERKRKKNALVIADYVSLFDTKNTQMFMIHHKEKTGDDAENEDSDESEEEADETASEGSTQDVKAEEENNSDKNKENNEEL